MAGQSQLSNIFLNNYQRNKMNSLEKTKKQIKVDEGLSLKPYFCGAGKLTVGIGRNLEDSGVTEEEAEYLLNNDIKKVISELNKADNGSREHAEKNKLSYRSFFIEQPEEIQSVLINMAFNLGTAGLLKFKKTLAFIADRRYTMASEEMLDSPWATQVGPRSKRLSKAVFECSPDAPSGTLHILNGTKSNEEEILVKHSYLKELEEVSRLAGSVLNKTAKILKAIQDD